MAIGRKKVLTEEEVKTASIFDLSQNGWAILSYCQLWPHIYEERLIVDNDVLILQKHIESGEMDEESENRARRTIKQILSGKRRQPFDDSLYGMA